MVTQGQPSTNATETSPLLKPSSKVNDSYHDNEANESAPTDTDNDPSLVHEVSLKKLVAIMSAAFVGLFFSALDNTIIATLAGPISSSFDSFSLVGWIASSYMIASATIQPISGKLTDIFGRRSGLLLAETLFAIGSVICGLANNASVLILGRVMSGLGGGATISITLFLLNDLVPLRRRGLWQGFGNLVYTVAVCLGGLFGGGLNDSLGWRWAFLIQVPFICLSAVAVAFLVRIPVRDTEKGRLKRVDFLGAALLSVFLVLFLLGIDLGGNHLGWKHPTVVVFLPVSAILLATFIWYEANVAPEPIIPVHLLLQQTVFSSCLVSWFGMMASTTIFYYIPLFFQAAGKSTTQAGLMLTPYSVGISLGAISSGLLMRRTGHYRLLQLCGMAIWLAGTSFNLTLSSQQPSPLIYLCLAVAGLGLGTVGSIITTALVAAVDREHQAVVTGANLAFRQTGSSIGITVAGAVFQNVLRKELWRRLGDKPDAARIIERLRENFKEISHVPASWRLDVMQGYDQSFHMVFILGLGITSLAAISGLFVKEHKLHTTLARD